MSRSEHDWLREAIELSRSCPVSDTAYSVGAIVVADHGAEVSRGFSRETDCLVHAEEGLLRRLGEQRVDLRGATIYSSLEPCSVRRSRPRSCTQLILAAGISRVVFALREPPLLADCDGAERLRRAGVQVREIPSLGPLVRQVNAHLIGAPAQPAMLN
ncbi:dCMP deaminase [Micromonospora mirobrigensis]|uniref:Diaminohydroxyphosphoribosylaminopyrimidine deaminase n=1 Tax=Micromonospora mirobrigensis TaxID=262898 RepID=A0A1C4ZBV6_9ACTN|nr:dCMP deaminase [Micromonospora mirobrigensis]SCF30440.1 diaminohydroxyphosphoribosylaminopyrimidine deaminase [Micromonospora mirobrigensis]